MIKFKAFLTFLLLVVYGFFMWIYNLYESPIRGVANAQQMHDSVHTYAFGKFVANDGITTVTFWIVVILIAALWLFGGWKKKNKQ